MKIGMIVVFAMIFGLSSCGYSSRNNDLTGQVKKVIHQTPIICPDRTDVDVSLGVMQNGVGSMSNQDLFLSVYDSTVEKELVDAAATGKPVKLEYGIKRWVWCGEDHLVTGFTYLK